MDGARFDRLTRTLSSRRTVLSGLLGSVAGLLGVLTSDNVEAHNFVATCRKITSKQRRAACLRRARRHNAQHKARVPPPPPPSCTGVVCAPVDHGTPACQQGVCVIASCDPGFGNCDGNMTTGCETSTQSNVRHCGTCGRVCPGQGEAATTVTCIAGKCRLERVFSFTSANAAQPFMVPMAGTLTVEARGGVSGGGGAGEVGPGGGSGGGGGQGAAGGLIRGRFTVNAGDDFRVVVGGIGNPGIAGGAASTPGRGGTSGGNGAINGATTSSDPVTRGGGGGGGGGPSDMRRSPFQAADRILAAGGGGGGGGGAGGPASPFVAGAGGLGGHGGTSAGGGTGGNPGTNAGSSGSTGGFGSSVRFDSSVVILTQQTGVNSGPGQVTVTLEAS